MDSFLEAPAGFVGAVTEASRALAMQVERQLHRVDNWSDEPRPEVLWKCLLFVLHLTDRAAFAYLPAASRELFMSKMLTILAKTIDEQYLRTEYNAVQKTYSAFKKLLPNEGEGTSGTLFWEFGKNICLEYADTNPAVMAMLALCASDTFIGLGKTFRECVRHS